MIVKLNYVTYIRRSNQTYQNYSPRNTGKRATKQRSPRGKAISPNAFSLARTCEITTNHFRRSLVTKEQSELSEYFAIGFGSVRSAPAYRVLLVQVWQFTDPLLAPGHLTNLDEDE